MRDGNVDCSDANRIVNIPGRTKSYCRLMLGDIVLSLAGSVGRVGIVAEPGCLLNPRVAVLVPVRKDTLAGLFFWFWQAVFKERMIGIAQRAAQSNLSPHETLQLEISYNSSAFSALCKGSTHLFDTILDNRIEMQALSSLRDALPSKLLSGEIAVDEVVQFKHGQ